MKSQRRMLVGMAVAVVVGLLVSARMPAATTAPDLRKAAPDFTLKDSHGATIRLSDYKGKVVLLDFWATWCHGCKIEIPWYVEFQNRYKQRGLSAIGVSMDDDGWKSVKPFLAKNKLNYPIVIGDENLAKQYDVKEMPVTLLIDQTGKIAESHAGMVDKDAFEADIRALLQANTKKRK
jgi:peroxiredoxin